VRAWARAGFLAPARGPGNRYGFSFQDLVLLRAAKSLRDARVPGRRIRRALRELARTLPKGRQLSELRIQADGLRVVVGDESRLWQPDSGQLLLDFKVGDLAARAAPIAHRHARTARANDDTLSAGDWFQLGLDLEAVDPSEAQDAYRRALALDPADADAHVNLGRLLQEQGRLEEAARHYREALRLVPRHATAAFNLGTVLEDQRKLPEAIAAYREAVAIDDRLAEAHYNLSRLYERSGQRQAAFRHLKQYRTLVEDSGPRVRR
jgi:tetratricopeptide (TPR) repeat protein